MAGAIATVLEHQRSADRTAELAANSGTRVIGYIDETVPRELITAAGFLPHRLRGNPTLVGDFHARYIEPLAPKGFSAARSHDVEHVNAILSRLLAGQYAFLDRLVISNTRKAILLIQHKVERARAHFPELRLPRTYILDRAQTVNFASGMFNRERVHAFRAALETWAGRAIDDAALASAIADENATRARLRRVRALRAATSQRLTGIEALAIYAAAKTMPGDAFRALADAALDEAEARAARDGVRLFLAGSPIDHTLLVAAIEQASAIVVGDDLAWGDAGAETDIRTEGDPIEALIAHYESLAPLVQPLEAQISRVAAAAQTCGASGAVLAVFRGDDIKSWEMPSQIAAFEAAGIPALYLAEQPYGPAADVPERVRAFVASLDGAGR